MTPRNNQSVGQYDLFKKRTEDIVHKNRPLVILSKAFNCASDLQEEVQEEPF